MTRTLLNAEPFHFLKSKALPNIMKPFIPRRSISIILQPLGLSLVLLAMCVLPLRAEFKAGAAVVDITPAKLPVLVNGGMTSRSVDKINTRIHARAIAPRSASLNTATVSTPSSLHARMTRKAISPRLAIRILWNMNNSIATELEKGRMTKYPMTKE